MLLAVGGGVLLLLLMVAGAIAGDRDDKPTASTEATSFQARSPDEPAAGSRVTEYGRYGAQSQTDDERRG